MSLIVGMGMSVQMGLGPRALRKLQSCLVAAEAACSSGDLPVATVEIALTAVVGFATATETAAVPAELAAVVAELLKATNGAAQPAVNIPAIAQQATRPKEMKKADPGGCPSLLKANVVAWNLVALTNNVKYPSGP
ncbi:MAG: hypothetical protein V4536_08260 [Pseudomonadota bacterium]